METTQLRYQYQPSPQKPVPFIFTCFAFTTHDLFQKKIGSGINQAKTTTTFYIYQTRELSFLSFEVGVLVYFQRQTAVLVPFYCHHHTSWGNFQTFFNKTILKPSTAKNSSKTLDPSISHLSYLQVASRLMSSSSSSRIYLARSPTKKQTR